MTIEIQKSIVSVYDCIDTESREYILAHTQLLEADKSSENRDGQLTFSVGFVAPHFRILHVVRKAKLVFPHLGHTQSPSDKPSGPICKTKEKKRKFNTSH